MKEYAVERVIDAGHPSLRGHFPGRPVVPGVVLLDEIVAVIAAERGAGFAPMAFPAVKFLAPLLPGESFTISVRDHGARIDFECRRGDATLLRGSATAGPLA